MKIISVVSARPNFMKIAPFISAVRKYNIDIQRHQSTGDRIHKEYIEHILVHTGQHYDNRMSDSFFEQLQIPKADINLGIGSGTHAEQVGLTMIEFEKVLQMGKPDWVVIVGDVNAILACSVTAKKANIKCCHIEAGLRSGDMSMPEEINRLVADRISDLLLTPDRISSENLKKEGISENHIKFVGNIMIDTLELNRSQAESLKLTSILRQNLLNNQDIQEVRDEEFSLITLHRPSNVDDKEVLSQLISFISETVARDLYVIWPIHPRTYKNIIQFRLKDKVENNPRIYLTHPMGYHEMLRLNMGAKIVLTDSGGLQEECTILGTPCITLRWNTERPITLRQYGGSNVLVGNNTVNIRKGYEEVISRKRIPFRPELWDGKTAERIVNELINYSI